MGDEMAILGLHFFLALLVSICERNFYGFRIGLLISRKPAKL